ncbi:MAG: glucosamine-6-phosphate deaminase [SAR324 cluster bacterium]|jgi:glucosamine-6-phosphate deaminase|nr:glucosamine-6-phosphate deaminase [SAR324 cluster bacterium]
MEILIRDTPEASAQVAADVVSKIIRERANLVLGLATGGTPLRMYQELIRMHQAGKLSFQNCTTFNLDEYVGLPPEDERSYNHYMRSNLFDRVDLDPAQTHLPDGDAPDLREACRDYEQKIKDAGGIDLQVLGIGANGHIGFNEPTGSLASRTWVKILSEQTIRDNAVHFDDPQEVPRHVVTMGISTIMEARHCLLLANGAKKADAVRRMIEGSVSASCPASILQMHPRVTVVLDEESAYLLVAKEHYKWIERNKLDWQRH